MIERKLMVGGVVAASPSISMSMSAGHRVLFVTVLSLALFQLLEYEYFLKFRKVSRNVIYVGMIKICIK